MVVYEVSEDCQLSPMGAAWGAVYESVGPVFPKSLKQKRDILEKKVRTKIKYDFIYGIF